MSENRCRSMSGKNGGLRCALESGHLERHCNTEIYWDITLALSTETSDEKINHPSHYGGDVVYETIKVIAAWGLGFDLGNCVKYISRAGKKAGSSTLEDLRKAKFYLEHAIAALEKEGDKP